MALTKKRPAPLITIRQKPKHIGQKFFQLMEHSLAGITQSQIKERLSAICVFGIFIQAYFLVFILLGFYDAALFQGREDFGFSTKNFFAATCCSMLLLNLATYAACRNLLLSAHRLVLLGTGYALAIGCFLSLQHYVRSLPMDTVADASLPWSAFWIVFFPLIVPANWRWNLVVCLSTGVFSLLILFPASHLLGVAAPSASFLYFTVQVYVIMTALSCYMSHLVHNTNEELARERQHGSYRLVRILGEGGMGTVWLARHNMLHRPAAIKVIQPEALGDVSSQERVKTMQQFEQEAQAMSSLFSPHTAAIYDFGVSDDGTFYYVMEALEGLTLQRLVDRYNPLSPERAGHVLIQVCDSLSEAHEKGLIHRDIKPSNLFISQYGRHYDFVKVLDFGIVKTTGRDDSEGPDRPENNFITGTPTYMSPESFETTEVDPRSDIYSLGVCAYFCLTGRAPFPYMDLQTIKQAHKKESPRPPSTKSRQPIPPGLDDAILACLEKDPNNRPQTAVELSNQLKAIEWINPWTEERAKHWWESYKPTNPLPPSPKPFEKTMAQTVKIEVDNQT